MIHAYGGGSPYVEFVGGSTKFDPTAGIQSNGCRVTGNGASTLSTGAGIEFSYSPDTKTGGVYAYDRDSGQEGPFSFGAAFQIYLPPQWSSRYGNVGIGTTSPTSKLSVSGDVSATNLLGIVASSQVTATVHTSTALSGSVSFDSVQNDETLYLSGISTITLLTVVLPTTTKIGQICRIHTRSAISTLSLLGTLTDGATLTTLPALGTAAFQATNTTGTFIRIQ